MLLHWVSYIVLDDVFSTLKEKQKPSLDYYFHLCCFALLPPGPGKSFVAAHSSGLASDTELVFLATLLQKTKPAKQIIGPLRC